MAMAIFKAASTGGPASVVGFLMLPRSNPTIDPLRRRMIEDMRSANSYRGRKKNIRTVKNFSADDA